ncbi:phosphotransferase enzyme family protein [Vallicoccus soli]|uniref:Aminoglycoside phosphotransferase family protein n=1 Tax=Vallicoccus soli TaxID=2339232 RepID=A0A3A3Z3H9_9ACTN|nr:phosphotransferase [Vallicoccus soli]RJK97483.1 aminoglycoside phosphotransferase family protein [Vallicoccus soli]
MDAAEVAHRFGLGDVVVVPAAPAARGLRGAVRRLVTTTGTWAVKVADAPVGDASAVAGTTRAAEAAARLQEAARRGGVPAPAVRRTREGAAVAVLHGRAVRVQGWVDVDPPDDRLDPAAVGRVLAAAHRAGGPARGPVGPWYGAPVGAAAWDRLAARSLAAGAPFGASLAAARAELVALDALVSPPEDLLTCHRDLWADNLRGTRGGGLCVLDWDESGPADPAQELGYVLFEFARDDPSRARGLVAAYEAAGGPARLRRLGQFGMLVAQLGHLLEDAVEQWLAAGGAPSAQRAAEVLDDLHSRERLHVLLEAARA